MTVRGDLTKFINTFNQPFGNPGNTVGDLIRATAFSTRLIARDNDNVPTDDPDLILPCEVKSVYEFRFQFAMFCDIGTPNSTLGIRAPANAIGGWMAWGVNEDSSNSAHEANDIGAVRNVALTGGVRRFISIAGVIQTTDTAGTIALQWSQQNSNNTPTIRREPSTFSLMKANPTGLRGQ